MSIFLYEKRFVSLSSSWILKSLVVAVALSTSVVTTAANSNQNLAENTQPQRIQNVLTFEQVLEHVKQFQTQTGIWQAQQDIAESNIRQSQLWENPTVSVQQTGFKSGKDQELELGISQKLDVFGVRSAAKKLASVQQNQVELNQVLYDAQLKLAVKYLWSQVSILELEHEVAKAQLRTSKNLLDATRLRFQAGSIAQVDLDRTLMTHVENQRLYQEVELSLSSAKRKLANLWGETEDNFTLRPDIKSAWPLKNEGDIDQYLKQNLLEQSMRLQAIQQNSEINYLKAKNRPTPTVNMGVVRSKTAETSSTENQIRVGIAVPLNIFNRQQYALKIAQSKLDLIAQQQSFYKKQSLDSIRTLQYELAGLKQQYNLMNEQQIPLSETVQEKMLLGFKVGKFAITDVQQSTLQLQEQRLKKVQLLKSAWQKAIEAESLALGIDPNMVMSGDALNQINQNLWQDTYKLPTVGGAE